MRIEILIGNSEEPLIYPLNKPKLTVGSAETCDIIVDAPNISRKHVQIVTEGDNFFVIDQGSTNGTFINEERLVPGRRTEFTSFFPVRLGDSVLITLLSDEEVPSDEPPVLSFPEATPTAAPKRGSDETTKMISLRDLQKAKTSDLVNRRQQLAKKKASSSSGTTKSKTAKPRSKRAEEKSRMKKIQFFVVLLLGAAAYVNFFVLETGEAPVAKIGEEIPIDPSKVQPVVEVTPPPAKVLSDSELPPRDRVEGLLSDIKCTLENEKYLCETLYKGNEGQFGTVRVGTMLYVLADGDFFYEEARRLLPLPATTSPDGQFTEEELRRYEDDLSKVMAAIYLLRAIPKDIDIERLQEHNLTIGLFRKNSEGGIFLSTVVSIMPSSLKELKRIFDEVHLSNVTKIGVSAIEFVQELYRVY